MTLTSSHLNAISRRTVPLAVGGLFLTAAVFKAASPASAHRVVLFLGNDVGLSPHAAAPIVACVVALEAAVGLALLTSRGRRSLDAAAVLLGVFSIVLARLAWSPQSPGCGCFGDLLNGSKAEAPLALVRNAALIIAVVGARFSVAPGVAAPRSTRNAAPAVARAGFTLVEMLVVIFIISIMISLALPALAGAKQSARATQSLSMLRQLVASTSMYAQDNKEGLPYLGVPGDFLAPITFRGVKITPRHDYFTDQSRFWASTLVGSYYNGSPETLELPNSVHRKLDARGVRYEFVLTRYAMTYTAFSAPESWTDAPPRDSSIFRGTSWHEMTHPSAKGLLLDVGFGMFGNDTRGDLGSTGLGDGSARTFQWRQTEDALSCYPPFAPMQAAVLSTRGGISGRDFR